MIEQSINEFLPGETSLLWMRQRTLWYNGHRYLRFSGEGSPKIGTRYVRQTGQHKHKRAYGNYAERIARANSRSLNRLEKDATDFIKQTASQFARCMPVVSFSGGKDSVVVSHLVRKALQTDRIVHIFGDTKNEFPDTYDFIRLLRAHNPSIPFVEEKSDRDWFDMCDTLQPPSRLTAWCCSVFKATSIAKAIQRTSAEGQVLCFEGVRRSESIRRRNRPAIAHKNKIARQILARPILYWREVDVWVYTLANRLPINMAYKRGLTRVGCLNCPYHTPRIDWWLQAVYPNHTNRWKKYIIEYARNKLGKDDPEDYWSSGAWKARVGNNGSKPRGQLDSRPCIDDDSVNFMLQRDFDSKALMNFLRPFGKVEKEDTSLGSYLKVSRNGILLFLIWGVDGFPRAKLTVFEHSAPRVLTQQITRQLRKYQACVYCGMCEVVCKYGSISVRTDPDEYVVDNETCISCLDCVVGNRIKGICMAINTSYGKPRQPNHAARQINKA